MQGRRRPQPSGTNRATAPARKGRAPRARRRPRRDRLASPCGPQGAPAHARRPRRSAALAAGAHPAPCRTRKLSPPRADGTAGAAPWESRSPPIDEADEAAGPRRGGRRVRGGPPFFRLREFHIIVCLLMMMIIIYRNMAHLKRHLPSLMCATISTDAQGLFMSSSLLCSVII